MLSTKNVPVSTGSGSGFKKTLSPGNHLVKIYDLELSKGYNPGSIQVILRVEGPDMGPDFDGFLKDRNEPNGPKHAGQVGRVRLAPYAFEDRVLKHGSTQTRDQAMLIALDRLSTSAGVKDVVQNIEAQTIEELFHKAKVFLVGRSINTCIGSKIYTNKSGYKENDLFLPRAQGNKYPHTPADDASSLLQFNEAEHIIGEKQPTSVDSFGSSDNDFDI